MCPNPAPRIAVEATAGTADRRKRARLRVHWPVQFRVNGSAATVDTFTEDLSSHGFYCRVATRFIPGEVRDCTLCVPARDPENESRSLRVPCRVRVLRVETLAEAGQYGVACRLEDYQFAESEPASCSAAGAPFEYGVSGGSVLFEPNGSL